MTIKYRKTSRFTSVGITICNLTKVSTIKVLAGDRIFYFTGTVILGKSKNPFTMITSLFKLGTPADLWVDIVKGTY